MCRYDDGSNDTFFHQFKWCDLLRETYGFRVKRVTVNGDEGLPVCSLTFCVARGLFGTRLVSFPFSDYGGPITRIADFSETGRSLAKAVDSLATELGARYALLKSTPPELARVLELRGFTPIPNIATFVVDLNRPFTQIERDFDKDVRRRVKKGIQHGLEITTEQGEGSVKKFYEVYLRDMRRHGSPPHDRKYFEKIRQKFEGSGQVKLLGCKHGGEMLGYTLHFLHRDTALFYVGVWTGTARQMGVAPFLISNSIRYFREEGFRVYDFGRTLYPSGESSFKESFGATYRPQNSLVKIYSGEKFLEPSDWKYRTLSKMLARMPLSLLARIGPKVKRQIE